MKRRESKRKRGRARECRLNRSFRCCICVTHGLESDPTASRIRSSAPLRVIRTPWRGGYPQISIKKLSACRMIYWACPGSDFELRRLRHTRSVLIAAASLALRVLIGRRRVTQMQNRFNELFRSARSLSRTALRLCLQNGPISRQSQSCSRSPSCYQFSTSPPGSPTEFCQ
jgi:hypothetical protein